MTPLLASLAQWSSKMTRCGGGMKMVNVVSEDDGEVKKVA